MDGYSYVPAAQVLPFNFIKKPIISALWYSALSVLLIQNDTISYLIGTAFFILSFTQFRFYLAIGSIIPMIAVVVLCFINAFSYAPYVAIAGIVWLICWITALIVTVRLAKGIYEILPVSNKMIYSLSYTLEKILGRR